MFSSVLGFVYLVFVMPLNLGGISLPGAAELCDMVSAQRTQFTDSW